MKILQGWAVSGVGHFAPRMLNFSEAFERATGEKLFPGTLNVRVAEYVPAKEHFRVRGQDIGEPNQDLLFEICRINGIWAYRIRPYQPLTGAGGHGDDVLEIACAYELRPMLPSPSVIEVVLFR